MAHWGTRPASGLLLILALSSIGCTVPIAGGLDERDANLVADALNRAGVESSKEIDPAVEGRYRVLIARDDTAIGIAALREHDLPPRHAPGVVDSVGKGALVPSSFAEHAQFVAGVSGDLERTLASVDGVLGARVHLSIPAANPLGDKPTDKPTASVLLKHMGTTPPVADNDIRRLVAGAVTGMRPEDVTVVSVGRPPSAAMPERQLSHLGPITVTRSSALWLKVAFGSLLLALLSMLGVVVHLWLRTRRLASQGEAP